MLRKIQLTMMAGAALLSLMACSFSSREDLLRAKTDALAPADLVSSLIFEQIFSSSGATGACSSTWLDKWYGTDEPYDSVMQAFEGQIAVEGWEIWPEDVTQIWRLETEDGLFTLVLVDVTGNINAQREGYVLSASTVNKLSEYQTAYLLRVGHMTTAVMKQCFVR